MSTRMVLELLHRNIFLVIPAVYTMVLFTYYLYNGILFQYTLGALFLTALPITLLLGRTKNFLRDLTPFIGLLLGYEALQGITGTINAAPVIQFTFSHNIVGVVQSTFYSPILTQVTTLLYGLHFPTVVVLSIVLWHSNRTLFSKYMIALVISSYIALTVYVLAPSAPPWYMGSATNLLQVNDPINGSNTLFSTLVSQAAMIESDPLAAMPSLHAAYIALFCYFAIRLRKIYALVSVPLAAGVLFSTIYLGQHYIVDLAAGVFVAVFAIFVATRAMQNNSLFAANTLKIQT